MKCKKNFTHEFCMTTALGTPGRLFTFRERAAKKEPIYRQSVCRSAIHREPFGRIILPFDNEDISESDS